MNPRAAQEWRKYALLWLFWGVFGFSVNAVWTREHLSFFAELAAILSFVNVYAVFGFYDPEGRQGLGALSCDGRILPFFVWAAGFAFGHFLAPQKAFIQNDLSGGLFFIHACLVVAYCAMRFSRALDDTSPVVRKSGYFTGAMAILGFFLDAIL